MPKKAKDVNRAASILGKRSAQARKKKWGKKEFIKKMREWGKLGGRPPKKQTRKAHEKKGRR